MRLKEGGALDHTWSTDPWNVLGFIIVAKSVNGFKEEGDSSFCILNILASVSGYEKHKSRHKDTSQEDVTATRVRNESNWRR